jgi:asparagine synthase (glutamine-hydrolysing)
MCGFAGFLDRSSGITQERLTEIVNRMTASVIHRGPDDGRIWVDAEAGIALGHRRLAILDLTAEGRQPMFSEDGRLVTVFNGEIYNFQELRAELERAGRRFRSRSDTEVMLAAFREWGVKSAAARFNGMFALALWDRKERTLTLLRDRFGKKPVYYGWAGKTLLFGSELKVLRQHPDFAGELNRGALALYLRHGYIPSPYSIYRGIYKLPPATWLTIRADQPAVAQPSGCGAPGAPELYWSLKEAAERGVNSLRTGPVEELLDELRVLLEDAVRLRMIADVPLGAFLSGGIDSSLVVGVMQSLCSRPVRTFSIGFQEPDYNEAELAKEVAGRLGTEHTELYVSAGEAMAVIPSLGGMFDEPFADSSQIPTSLVAKLARRHVTVSLSGDGGDELFGGYHAYLVNSRAWERIAGTPAWLRAAAGKLVAAIPGRVWGGAYRAVEGVLPEAARRPNGGWRFYRFGLSLARTAQEEYYRELISQWEQPARLLAGVEEPGTAFTDRLQWARLPGFVERMMYLDMQCYLPDDILTKVDRASMAVSLETRCPLLDYRLAEFAWRVPTALKLRDGQGKWLLRQLAYRYVPRSLLDRPKKGFAVPIGEWLRGPLREWAEELVRPERLKREGVFEPGAVERRWSAHLAGEADWSSCLWSVLMFQLWSEASRGGAECEFCN